MIWFILWYTLGLCGSAFLRADFLNWAYHSGASSKFWCMSPGCMILLILFSLFGPVFTIIAGLIWFSNAPGTDFIKDWLTTPICNKKDKS